MTSNPLLFFRRIHQFHTPANRIAGWPDDQHSLAGIIFSAGVHVLVVVLVLVSPFIGSRTPIIPEIYQVELVNVSEYKAPGTTKVATKPIKVKIATRTQSTVISRKAVSLNPIRNRLLKEARNIEEADQRRFEARLARIKSEAEAEKMRQQARKEANRAVSALARNLTDQEKTVEGPETVEPPVNGNDIKEEISPTVTGGEGNDSGVTNVISADYLSRLGVLIQRHWILPDLQKKWPENMQARIKITLTPEGRLKNLTFLKKARDFRFNVQAEKALRRSSPFPPPPPEIAAEANQIVLTFTPEEVR